ncbi:hypothetical protein E2542_SST27851 [Spatholobus suberectus]|nr:hypothetical protein E2542_SST27851 [Spatholobus suberectus]
MAVERWHLRQCDVDILNSYFFFFFFFFSLGSRVLVPKEEKPKPNPRKSESFIGSFCPGAGSPHLHRHVYFTESLSETVPRSLRLSCGSELTRQGIRYLRTVIVTAAVHRASVVGSPVIRSPTSLTFRHWAGVSPHTWSYDLRRTCVFAIKAESNGGSHETTDEEDIQEHRKAMQCDSSFLDSIYDT